MRAMRSLVIAVIVAGGALAIDAQPQVPPKNEGIRTIQVQPNFYMIAGAGGNVGVAIGQDGVILVDSGSASMADGLLAAVKQITSQPIRYIINTSADPDHVGGNEKVARGGRSLFGGANPAAAAGGGVGAIVNNGGGASIIAREPVLTRMGAPTGSQSPYPSVAWPTETFTRRQKALYLNNEAILTIAQPAAHTDGDAIVMFRRSDVVVTGDIFDVTRFPAIDLARGGSLQGEIDALNRLIELVVPSIPQPWKEGGTQVIPGHGRVCEQGELVEYRDMVVVVRDRVQDLIKSGKTLDQIQAANPAQGYRTRYGSDSGPWTTRMFIEAVYKSLTAKP